MENKLDQLFKNKLAKREEIPSPQAWGQIQGQLKTGRRKMWVKRLAVAAAILLFATIGVGLLNIQSSESEKSLSKSMNGTMEKEQPEVGYRMDKVFSRIIGVDSGAIRAQTKEHNHAPAEQQAIVLEKDDLEMAMETKPNTQKRAEQLAIKKREVPNKEKKMTKTEKADSEIPTRQIAIATQEKAEIMEKEGILEVVEAPLLAGNAEVETAIEPVPEKKKNRKVTIIYKASKNSALVDSGKKNILEKGIGEISKFSDEHLLTENRKTQLSQKKDDLMALNFGKLFTNKSD